MVIVRATIIGLIIVAASVAARVIAEADYRLALPASSQRSRPSADLTSRDVARRIAANIAKLPELVRGPAIEDAPWLSGARDVGTLIGWKSCLLCCFPTLQPEQFERLSHSRFIGALVAIR
jgi:hypothetical protein